MGVCKRDDGVLTEETREKGEARYRKRGNQPGNGGDRHIFGKSTHQAHILYLFMRGVV